MEGEGQSFEWNSGYRHRSNIQPLAQTEASVGAEYTRKEIELRLHE
jgi:hypothetical protein